MPTILKSETLTALSEQRDKLTAKAVQCRAEAWRLTTLVSPQLHDATVVRSVDEGPPPKTAFIGLKNSPNKPGVLSTGANEVDDAARKEDILQRTLAGETLPETTGVKEQLEKVNRQYAAYEDAIEHLDRQIDRERTVLAIQYCNQRKPEEAELMRRVCKSLIDLHAVWSELHKLKQHLVDSEIGLRGICLDLPDWLGAPSDRYSEMAEFLILAKSKGHIKELPKAYRA
jgi:hypothetical protein